MTTTPQAALLREAAQNALITLDGIANANPRDKTDFDTPDEWIAWAKSRARWAADALREPVAREVYAERILKQMLHEASQATQEPVQAGELPPPPTLSDDERSWLSCNPNTSDIEQWVYGYAVAYARAALASKVKQAGELPPLPESEYSLAFHDEGGAQVLCATAYTDDQMHAYARAALAARKPLTLLSKSQLSDIFEKDPRWHTPPIGATDIEFANDAIAEFCRINGIGLEVKP